MFRRYLFLASAIATVMFGQAWADDYGSTNHGQVTIQQATSMMAYSAGNDQAQVSIAPNWSDELGFSVRAAAGGYLGDEVALGAIVEYGQNKQEYITSLGFQFSDSLSLIGTVGQLAEHKEFVSGEGDDKATQMEYGLSLKLAPQAGLGFELNGYAVDAKAANESIETGKLYGTEALATVGLADTTLIKIGGGYEWLEWDGGEQNDHWTFRTEANQRLTDVLALQGHAKLGASERSYGGGLNLNLSNDGTNLLGLNYTYIEGRDGIADDKRVELGWTYGFGAGPSSSAAAMGLSDKSDTINAVDDAAIVTHANNLLGDVIKRPGYLPQSVIARVNTSNNPNCFNSLAYTDPNLDAFDNFYGYGTDKVFFYVEFSIDSAGAEAEVTNGTAIGSLVVKINGRVADDVEHYGGPKDTLDQDNDGNMEFLVYADWAQPNYSVEQTVAISVEQADFCSSYTFDVTFVANRF